MSKTKGFTLTEMAIVMILIGIISGITAKWLPFLLRESENARRASEFRSAAKSELNGILVNKPFFLPSPSRLYPYPQLDGFTDSQNIPWGYLPAFDTTASSGKGVCNRIMQGSITLRYCMDKNCAVYKDRPDIALLLFSNRQDLLDALTFGSSKTVLIDEESYKSSSLILYLKKATEERRGEDHNNADTIRFYDSKLIAYANHELWDMLDCPGIGAVVPAFSDLPSAYKGEPYGYSGMNFAKTNGVKYCFTQSPPETGFIINGVPFSDICDESAIWTEDKNHNDLWTLSGIAPSKVGMIYITGYAKISADNYTIDKIFVLPVSAR